MNHAPEAFNRLPPYPQGAGHRGVETSIDAAEGVDSKANRLRAAALQCLQNEQTGLTVYEISKKLNIPFFNIQPRISELKAAGSIIDSGLRREGRTHHKAVVWVLNSDSQPSKPPKKLKPIGNKELFGKMIQATIAYARRSDIENLANMLNCSERWIKDYAHQIYVNKDDYVCLN